MMQKLRKNKRLPTKQILMIQPEYVHYRGDHKDTTAVIPLSCLYAGQLLENQGYQVTYQDNQLHPLQQRDDLDRFDNIGISVMGAQNIAVAYRNYNRLLDQGIAPKKIMVGGQGIDGLTQDEFQRIFPQAIQMTTQSMMGNDYWGTTITNQLEKLSEEDLEIYLNNEVTVLLSQGCSYGCVFCGAKTNRKEKFFEVEGNLETYLIKARDFGIKKLHGYVTSLDFFQQALPRLGGDTAVLKRKLQSIIDIQRQYGVSLKLRALTRADSYMEATKDSELFDLVFQAGFYQFGFGADGAASPDLIKAMHKGSKDLQSDLLSSFGHAQTKGLTPEILYVFGVTQDTYHTLSETKKLCIGLLDSFSRSIYRGFPAKNEIPGNKNWEQEDWKDSIGYQRLMDDPELFSNLGFETLANCISHPIIENRKAVNHFAIQMSYHAHQLGRVQSFLTVPIMDNDGHELMDEKSFELFKEIIRNYVPELVDNLTLENLPRFRDQINKKIPKDV